MTPIRRSKKPLSVRKIKNLKELAHRIDMEEAASIRTRGQAAFMRHDWLRSIVSDLKQRRLRQGLSLADLSRRTGIAKPNLSRLENSRTIAPTLDTLERYARAVGMTVRLELEAADAA